MAANGSVTQLSVALLHYGAGLHTWRTLGSLLTERGSLTPRWKWLSFLTKLVACTSSQLLMPWVTRHQLGVGFHLAREHFSLEN